MTNSCDQEIIAKNPPPGETGLALPWHWKLAKLKPFHLFFLSLLSFRIATSVSHRKYSQSLASSQQTSHKNTAKRKEHLLACNIFAESVYGIAHVFRISTGSEYLTCRQASTEWLRFRDSCTARTTTTPSNKNLSFWNAGFTLSNNTVTLSGSITISWLYPKAGRSN